ncbi:MAG: Mov34/MPN/PAD-1 family protein [Gammaproteobacteria bacterium]|nr:Mov34/MPN/PAD-1 family protein [Gammaproteobacteria bacterium]
MEISVPYRFVAEVLNASGARIGDYPLTGVDFEPAVQCAHLQELRELVERGEDSLTAAPAPARIEPVPCPERGTPYIGGIEVLFPGRDHGREFPKTLFHSDVVRGSGELVRAGTLRDGETFAYRICAFPVETVAVEADFELEPTVMAMAVAAGELSLERRAPGSGWDDADLPVVIAQPVLDEAASLASRAGELETGGLLLGRVVVNAQPRYLSVEITALITAPGAIGTQTSLRLGPESFAAVERTLALRDRSEEMVGWWHSHPHFCSKCPAAEQRNCVYAKPFFSQADSDVHRTLFPQAHSQALLISDLGAQGQSIDLFGWRQGSIQARGFYEGGAAGTTQLPTIASPAEGLGVD